MPRSSSTSWSLVLVLALVACRASEPTAPEADGPLRTPMRAEAGVAASAAGSRVTRWTGQCDTQFEVVASEGPRLTLAITGRCLFPGLGRPRLSASQVVDFATGGMPAITTEATYDFGGGHTLATTFRGAVTSMNGPALTFAGTETAQGGTGRLAGSTGSTAVTGSADQGTGKGTFTTQGALQN